MIIPRIKQDNTMKYSVLGTGAIGGYYGAKLQKSGLSVDFLARSDYKKIKEKGLIIDSVNGNFTLDKVNVYSSVIDMPETDVILVSMKTTANCLLKELMAPLVKEGTIILVLQNGLGMEEEIREDFPEAIVLGGMCFICSRKEGPGHINHVDKGSITSAPVEEKHYSLLEEIQKDFTQAGIEMNLHRNLTEARWRKLLWNIPYNGLAVVLGADTKEIMDSEYGSALARRLMDEVARGAAACGCPIEEETIKKMLYYTHIMTPYEPSMKLDYNHKRPMEIEYMYRRPIREAEKRGVELTSVKMLADQLSFMEMMSERS